jgi:hypothetical protein
MQHKLVIHVSTTGRMSENLRNSNKLSLRALECHDFDHVWFRVVAEQRFSVPWGLDVCYHLHNLKTILTNIYVSTHAPLLDPRRKLAEVFASLSRSFSFPPTC